MLRPEILKFARSYKINNIRKKKKLSSLCLALLQLTIIKSFHRATTLRAAKKRDEDVKKSGCTWCLYSRDPVWRRRRGDALRGVNGIQMSKRFVFKAAPVFTEGRSQARCFLSPQPFERHWESPSNSSLHLAIDILVCEIRIAKERSLEIDRLVC